jgi:hypothetical protein
MTLFADTTSKRMFYAISWVEAELGVGDHEPEGDSFDLVHGSPLWLVGLEQKQRGWRRLVAFMGFRK